MYDNNTMYINRNVTEDMENLLESTGKDAFTRCICACRGEIKQGKSSPDDHMILS